MLMQSLSLPSTQIRYFERNVSPGASAGITILSPQGSDGTVLVSQDGEQLPYRIEAENLFLNLNITAPSDGLPVGSKIKVDRWAFDKIQKISPRGRMRGAVLGLKRSKYENRRRDGEVHTKLAQSARHQENDDHQKWENRLRSQYYSTGGTYEAPQLLDISYRGSHTLRSGASGEWDVSVLEGAAPLALITIVLDGPYDTTVNLYQSLPTPAGFGGDATIITNQTISFTVPDPWMNGTYTIESISLETQVRNPPRSAKQHPSTSFSPAHARNGCVAALRFPDRVPQQFRSSPPREAP